MIVVDPDLDPEPTIYATTAKRAHSADPTPSERKLRLPTARALSRFLNKAQAAVRLRGQVTVLLTTDAAIRRLNRNFRGKNKATDVLSFPADFSFPGQRERDKVAGDLAISVTTALRQARGQNHSLAIEIKVLILHGLLHLAGYDHEIDNGKMARRERVLRARLRLPQGLIERTYKQISPARVLTKSAKKATAR